MINLLAPLDLCVFHNRYIDARTLFMERVSALPKSLIRWQKSFEHPERGSDGEALFCDMVLLAPHNVAMDKILVVQSATHGIEGFMGSAVQCDLLNQVNSQNFPARVGILLIHALNPWGFSWQRRGDHQNIDQNRNFVDFTQALPENKQYDALADKALRIWQTQSGSIADFVGTVTQGQYHNADGIFYGGVAPSWSNTVLQSLKKQLFWQDASAIHVLDLHTGLGPYGYGELINDHLPDTQGFASAVAAYGANTCSALLGESCSAPKTGLVDYFWHALIGQRGHFVTLEFGTFPAEALVGLLLEEQHYQNQLNGQKRDLNAPEVRALLHFFYPFECSWQQQILWRSRQVIAMSLQSLKDADHE